MTGTVTASVHVSGVATGIGSEARAVASGATVALAGLTVAAVMTSALHSGPGAALRHRRTRNVHASLTTPSASQAGSPSVQLAAWLSPLTPATSSTSRQSLATGPPPWKRVKSAASAEVTPTARRTKTPRAISMIRMRSSFLRSA